MKKIGQPQSYDLVRTGNFGRFSSGESFPIEYVMTTFPVAELAAEHSYLSYARDIRPEKLDFELLMQRDIDEARVREKIEPYLNPSITTDELRSRALFFPPLLAAIVPTKGKHMLECYPDEISAPVEEGGVKYLKREWPGVFQLTYYSGEGVNALALDVISNGSTESVLVDRDPVKLEVRIAKGNQLGAKLVVIDGQHRLFALQEVYEKKPELFEQLIVPVCILFAPSATSYQQERYGGIHVPTVPEVFRHLFVDVNSNAELVGGHFNILLSDESIGSLVCRKFCDRVLAERGPYGLAAIEWNTKKKKDSAVIKRDYSLTSVGVIDEALKKSFGRPKSSLMKYVLNLPERESDLYPNDKDPSEFPKVEWERFSLTQKRVLVEQVEKYLVPILDKIFFGTKAFQNAYSIFANELNSLETISKSHDAHDAADAGRVVDQVLEYMPIKKGKNYDNARAIYSKFELSVEDKRRANTPSVLNKAIFQRAIFDALAALMDLARDYSVNPLEVAQALVILLDEALRDNGAFFAVDRHYMQHAIYSGPNIKAKEDTKRAFANLIIANLGYEKVAEQVGGAMMAPPNETTNLHAKLLDMGQEAAAEYVKHYENERKKEFINKYRVDFASLDKDEREELAKLEDEYKSHLREVREGKRTKENVSDTFDKKVDMYVKEDLAVASAELKKALRYSVEIVPVQSEVGVDED